MLERRPATPSAMNLLSLFHKSRSNLPHAGHMTFASSRVGQTVSRAGAFMKRQLWIWPIVAVVLLTGIGVGVGGAIKTTMKDNLASQLTTLLDAEVAMLRTWIGVQTSNAESAATRQQFRDHVYQLLDGLSDASDVDEPIDVESVRKQIARDLAPLMSSHDYVGFFLADKSQRIIAADAEDLIGQQDVPEFASWLARGLDGELTVAPPFQSVRIMQNADGRKRTGVPTMYVVAPVRDADFQVVAALALQIRPEEEFTDILQLGRIGESGETYAFDDDAVMVSNSRFDEDLILLGLLPDVDDARSLLGIQIRDPGGNMTQGYRPQVRRAEQALTRMAEDAIAGNSGVDVEGYNDYRGVPVVGAWTWLSEYDVGVVTEVDVAEAFRPLTILRRTFWGLFALLAASAVAIFVFTLIVSQLQREAQKAAVEAQQLGQYALDEKIGTGGMGVVYRAHHAMLRRPTAVKLLDLEKVNDDSIARFEREVQITCSLTHPNTIAIYDYGRTPEGVFYYAMEYLDGIDLQDLVARYGPQPEGRVIHILRQMCGSLYEAHSIGLVHRDVKPANVMLNRRGGESDVVKVLDFGLVKALDEQKAAGNTAADGLTGTPQYMSPEAIQMPLSVDHRSDLYAVGAVGYFLLTGTPVFDAANIMELCRLHVDQPPELPSKRLGGSVSKETENALLACLEKERAKRPQTARDLIQMLNRSPEANRWSLDDADQWWGSHERGSTDDAETSPATESGAFDRTIIGGET